MPNLTYVSQSPTSVQVSYADMPAGAEVVFVNTTTGAKTAAPGNALGSGGAGAAAIAISGIPQGRYHLLAQQSGGQYLAETISFNIS